MRKTVVLTPFHEEYLVNTVAQVRDLLWAQFEKENKTDLKDEPYLYKNEDIIYQDRIVAEAQGFRDLLNYILEGGRIKFQQHLVEAGLVERQTVGPDFKLKEWKEYSNEKIYKFSEEDEKLYQELLILGANGLSNQRSVLSLVEYPESWTFIYKKSRIGFQSIGSKKQEILKIFNRNSTSEKKGYSTNEGLSKLKITKSGFVRYFNGQSCRWLSLKNWHNTKLPFGEEVLRLLVSINPNNEFLRKEQKNFYFTKYDIANKDLRKSTSWKSLYRNMTGFYREEIPLIVATDLADKIPKNSLEGFLARIDQNKEAIPNTESGLIRTGPGRFSFFQEIYHGLLQGKTDKKSVPESSWSSYLVSDAYRMAKDLDEEFNYKIESAKKFKEYHDDLAKRHRLRELGPLKPHEKFKILKSGKYEVEYIETSERLVQEAVELHHCVSSYASSINSGHCGIYSIWDGEKRWTCELQYRMKDLMWDDLGNPSFTKEKEKGFYIVQCRGLHNKNAPKEVVDFIQEQLDEVNKEK